MSVAIVRLVLGLTALWHLLAAYHFALHPGRTIARYSHERPVSPVAAELIRFLGGLNLALAVLGGASFAFPPAALWPFALCFFVANLTQAVIDLQAHRKGLTRPAFLRDITLGDGIATALNLGVLGLYLLP